jgi:RNA polymerase subunit RPABC4/transcription elongation factor Spt4
MENYIGKICPFCKTEITEADAVKVCPACGIPHHEGCWEENHGCTTFGCSEQHYEAQHTNPTDVCTNCGAPLGDGQAFCPKCGTPKAAAPKKNICGKCGNELDDGQEFCPKCGQRAGLVIDSGVSSAINQFNAGIDKSNEAKKKKPIKAIIAAAVAVAVIAVGALVVPKLFVSVEELCAQGNYEKAYEKADADEKLEIKAENAAAVQSAFSADNLKDPNSFVLRDAYYKEGKNDDGTMNKQLVLYISGANSYGASVSSYWLYTWDAEEDDWSYFCSVSDLSEEEYNSYDDEDERLEKLLNNIGRTSIKNTMNDGIKLSKDAVKRINAMFEADILDEVELLDVD